MSLYDLLPTASFYDLAWAGQMGFMGLLSLAAACLPSFI
jgi:hypothetical protein